MILSFVLLKLTFKSLNRRTAWVNQHLIFSDFLNEPLYLTCVPEVFLFQFCNVIQTMKIPCTIL